MSSRIENDSSTIYNGISVNTPFEDESSKMVKVEDFLTLMVAQLSNQDFMNPVDDTQYVTQLAQFATMQSMQDMSSYMQTNYATSLVGKTVTVASLGLGGNVNKDVGVVSSVNLSGDSFTVTVNGKQYQLSQIMSVSATGAASGEDIEEAGKMSVIAQEIGEDYIVARWDAPVSDEAAAQGLVYDVYITTDSEQDFNTLAGVKQGEKVASDLKELTHTINGLEGGTTYYINVVVRNGSGDEAVYQQVAAITK